jgi:hypothetical protein
MSGVQEFLQRDPGHFMSLRDVLTRMAADGANHKEAAQALRRLLMWSPDLRDRPEWVVSGPDELWVAEDEDTGRPWKHLERATHSGLPPTGGRGEKAFDRFGFFAGVIIPFLAKNGIDISTDQSSTTPGPTGEQEQANIPPAISEETPEQSETAPSGTTEKAAPEVTPEDDNERADALTPMAANDPEKSDAAHSGSTEQSQPTTKTRINKVRACLELFLRDGVSPHIESIWLHIGSNAGKAGFPFATQSADTAVHVEGNRIKKTSMSRSLSALLRTRAKG